MAVSLRETAQELEFAGGNICPEFVRTPILFPGNPTVGAEPEEGTTSKGGGLFPLPSPPQTPPLLVTRKRTHTDSSVVCMVRIYIYIYIYIFL